MTFEIRVRVDEVIVKVRTEHPTFALEDEVVDGLLSCGGRPKVYTEHAFVLELAERMEKQLGFLYEAAFVCALLSLRGKMKRCLECGAVCAGRLDFCEDCEGQEVE